MDVLAKYAECVGRIHEAAVEPDKWADALQASMDLFGASGILLTDVDTVSGNPRSILTGGHDPALLQAYAGYYAGIDPTIAVGLTGEHGTVYHLREHFSEHQMAHGEYFQDFLFAFGVSDVMAVPIDYAPGARSFVSLQRRVGESHFDSNCHPLLGLYVRQLHIAKQTEAKLRGSLAKSDLLARGLDGFSAAVLIVDGKGLVHHYNRAARALIETSASLALRSGRIGLKSPNDTARLQAACRAACLPGGKTSSFSVSASGAQVLRLVVTPLHPTHPLCSTWQEPLVLVLATHGIGRNAVQLLAQLFGLTKSESILVAGLANGKTLREIAESRPIGMATLRTHLAAVFSKTATRGQADLMRLMASISIVGEQPGATSSDH